MNRKVRIGFRPAKKKLEKRIPCNDGEHDGADGDFADGAPDAAEEGAASGGGASGFVAAFPGFSQIGAGKGASRATQEGADQRAGDGDDGPHADAEDAADD